MIKSLSVFLLFLSSVCLQAQENHDGLKIHRSLSNFGEVEFWLSRVDTFSITNTTDKTIYILKQIVPRYFELKTPTLGIAPGETSQIEVIYTPQKVGKFKQKLQLYHSNSNTPFFFEFKGELKAFDEYAKLSCPSFSEPNYRKPNFNMEINVIDSLTRKPIKGALTELSKGEDFQQFYTNKDGQVKRKSHLGLFFIYTEAKGYQNKNIEHYFNPQKRSVTITLVSNKKEIKLLDEVEIDLPLIAYKDTSSHVNIKVEYAYTPLDTIPIRDENINFPSSKYEKNNVVFLIDVSSSMRGHDRLELLKKSMIQLTYMLRSIDKVTIITYSDDAQIVLESTSADSKEEIINVIKSLKVGGSTYGGKAIRKAFKVLKEQYLVSGNNQVILATDGGFNGLGKSENQLNRFVKGKSKQGLHFSTLGFGKNKRGKDLIEALAISGSGEYLYIQTEVQAEVDLNKMIMRQSAIEK